jgi:hypothetical protein
MGHGMGFTIAWTKALLSCSKDIPCPAVFLYSSLQNILAHKAFILKCFTKKKRLKMKKKEKPEIIQA